MHSTMNNGGAPNPFSTTIQSQQPPMANHNVIDL